MFNMPSGVVPVSKVTENEQFYKDDINDEITKSFKLNMENSKGLPVGVIVSALPWKDELACFRSIPRLRNRNPHRAVRTRVSDADLGSRTRRLQE